VPFSDAAQLALVAEVIATEQMTQRLALARQQVAQAKAAKEELAQQASDMS